jgi:hypothetical protein
VMSQGRLGTSGHCPGGTGKREGGGGFGGRELGPLVPPPQCHSLRPAGKPRLKQDAPCTNNQLRVPLPDFYPLQSRKNRTIFFRGDKATIYQFGRGADPLDEQTCRGDPWYYEQEAAWSRVALVLGNNVFADDRAQRRLRFLPKFVRHVVCHVFGVRPGYMMYTGHILRAALLSERRPATKAKGKSIMPPGQRAIPT